MSDQFSSPSGIRALPDYLALEQALPDTTSADGNNGGVDCGYTQNGIDIVCVVNEAIDLTGTLTIKLQESTTKTGSYTDIPGRSIALTNPNEAAKKELLRFSGIGKVGPFVKAVITTSATPTTAGKIDIFQTPQNR